MTVDFWQLGRDPVDKVVALIAQKIRADGQRLLVVSGDAGQRETISTALWDTAPVSFLANGEADAPHAERQPILLSGECVAVNGANHVVFADGKWRDDADKFGRSFLLFGQDRVEEARACWRSLDGSDDIERSFYRQDQGKWTKIA